MIHPRIVTITFRADTAAFEDNPHETSRILRKLASRLDGNDGREDYVKTTPYVRDVFDKNGIRVGTVIITD